MDREVLGGLLDEYDALRAKLAAFDYATLTGPELVAVYERREHAHRQDAALDHTVLAALADRYVAEDYGGTVLKDVLAERLHLDSGDITARLKNAEQLGPRWTLTGEELPPRLAHCAAGLARGELAPQHVEKITEALNKLPGWADETTRTTAERDLAQLGAGLRPADVREAGKHLGALVDPDGDEPNDDLQQRQRTLHVGRQQADGMTRISGYVDPETRALLDVVNAKEAAPGANLPAGDAEASEALGKDVRTLGQRQHDAFKTVLARAVASGELGQVAGVPATIVATTTVAELERATGWAHTASGTRLPIRDLIRMAGQARHYLAVFDNHHREVLYLGRARRCASVAQRLALFARDKGCTRPGCTKPFLDCEAHHAHQDFAKGGRTNINELTLACSPDNQLIENTDWITQRRNGYTHWIPPQPLDTGQHRINHHHHPQRYLTGPRNDDDPG
jgi:hypothetical protein